MILIRLLKRLKNMRQRTKRRKKKSMYATTPTALYIRQKRRWVNSATRFRSDEKASVQTEVDKLKELLKATPLDTEATKAQTEAVQKSFYAISEKLYAQAQQAQQAAGGAQGNPNGGAAQGGAPGGDNVVDAEYTEVNDDNK